MPSVLFMLAGKPHTSPQHEDRICYELNVLCISINAIHMQGGGRSAYRKECSSSKGPNHLPNLLHWSGLIVTTGRTVCRPGSTPAIRAEWPRVPLTKPVQGSLRNRKLIHEGSKLVFHACELKTGNQSPQQPGGSSSA